MEQRWCLGNKKTSKVEKNLYPNQVAQRIIESFRDGYDESDWVVWLPGWPAWAPLTENTELMHEISLLKELANQPPPPMTLPVHPPPPINRINNKNEFINETLQLEKNKKIVPIKTTFESLIEKRKHHRISARYRCIIRSTTLTFRTFTKDISLGGVALEDEIPMDLIGTHCMIYISSSKINKNLRFKIILTSRSITKYFTFKDADQKLLEELKVWLDLEKNIKAA